MNVVVDIMIDVRVEEKVGGELHNVAADPEAVHRCRTKAWGEVASSPNLVDSDDACVPLTMDGRALLAVKACPSIEGAQGPVPLHVREWMGGRPVLSR